MIKSISQRKEAEAEIQQRYARLKETLSERARRLFAAREVLSFGYGGIAAVVRATGMSVNTVRKGIEESRAIEAKTLVALDEGRCRRPGGGRKKATDKDPSLLPAFREILEPTGGDQESPLLWTTRSQRNLVQALANQGYKVSTWMVAKLLRDQGYRLQTNRKRFGGTQHPDRDAQFEQINDMVWKQLRAGQPSVSVDTKRRELSSFDKESSLESSLEPTWIQNQLREEASTRNYDLLEAETWNSISISQDNSKFIVEAVRAWWKEMGRSSYPRASSLLIVADGGSCDGYRLRPWKLQLQGLADGLQIPIRVCHLPLGTIKWNRIEQQQFSFIAENKLGKPLVTHQVIIELIGSATTQAGPKIEHRFDEHIYIEDGGASISNKQTEKFNLVPGAFYGEWNYTIHPSSS